MQACPRKLVPALASLCVVTAASAQDSVSSTPGNSDALSAYSNHLTRFVLDMVPLTSSWNNSFYVGPVLKASADSDPMFNTQILGAAALSPDQLESVSFSSEDYSLWLTPGQGINPAENNPPGLFPVTGFDRQFSIASNDLSASATNVVGALVGQDLANPERLFVTRITALASRVTAGDMDTATVSIGGIDANGNTYARLDDFNATSPISVSGENIVHVDLTARSTVSTNFGLDSGGGNLLADPGASTLLVDNEVITTNVPAAAHESGAGSPLGLVLDFAGEYKADGASGTTGHIAAGVDAHRGNPSFTASSGAGIGTVASLARLTGSTLVNTINYFEIDSAGAVLNQASMTLPASITDGSFTTNTSGDAQFLHYLSQVSFRGGSGQIAAYHTGSTTLLAATATDPTDGDFIGVADSNAGTWTIAAHIGKSVLDGAGGSPIGTIASASPASISSPAIDALGNVYFVANFDPTVGSETTAFIKAVNNPGGYELELLLKAGDAFAGANSGRTYTIDDLHLGDSDSVASGTMFSASVLQQQIPGTTTPAPADPWAFGGAVVNAKLTYNNGGTTEDYQAVLFVGPSTVAAPTGCDGDADGNGAVDTGDISYVIFRLGNSGAPCIDGDINGDGVVDSGDISYVIFRLGVCNPGGPCAN